MADKSKQAKKQAKKLQKAKKKGRGLSFGMQVLLIIMALASVLFLPLTVMLVIGMAPTIVLLLVNWKRKKSKVVTVGALNMAGCSPYAFKLWTSGMDFSNSMYITLDPNTILVMYGAALVGYIVDWALSGIVAGVMLERAKARLKSIDKRQAELEERWGKKVTGEVALDKFGFPVEESKKK